MRKVLVYPFSNEIYPFIQQGDLLNNIDVVSIVSLKGNGFSGDRHNFKDKVLEVTEDFDKALDTCEYVLLYNFYKKDIEDTILKNIKKAVKCNKKIIFFNSLNGNINNLLQIIPPEKQIMIETTNFGSFIQESEGRLYNIDTPVVFVCSIFEGLDKFNTQLSLRKKLLNDNYKILQIGTRQICELFNFYSFPSFMYSNDIAEHDKVVMFNNVLKKLEVEQNPDIIVIGIPGGILPFSSKSFGDLGLTMYKILQAVTPDCTILSLPYGKYSNEDIAYFGRVIKSKFNIEIDYYNIVSKSILAQQTESKGIPKYLTLEEPLIKKKVETLKNDNVFYLSNEFEIERLTNSMILEFIKYGTLSSI